MQDTMNALMKQMNSLKKATTVLNAWTILVIIILASLIGVNLLLPALLPESLLVVLGGVYLAFLLILLIINRLVKDTQKQIMIGLIRAFIGLLAIPLVLFCSTLLVKVLGLVFAVVFLVILVLLFMPVSKLAKLQKQLMAKAEAKPEAKAKPKARPKSK